MLSISSLILFNIRCFRSAFYLLTDFEDFVELVDDIRNKISLAWNIVRAAVNTVMLMVINVMLSFWTICDILSAFCMLDFTIC